MKHIFLSFLILISSLQVFGQNTEAQNLTIINIVRNNTLSPARVANALDALNYSKQGILQAYTASGTDTYAVTGPVAITAYASGQIVFVTFTNANTGAATLNINSTGAVDLKDNEGNALAAGALVAGGSYIFKHNGTDFWMVGASGGGGSGTPGGADTQVQYNDAGAFGGEADMAYNETTNTLTVDVVAVDTEVYDATGWNGDLTVPTKDAVRDKIETLEANTIAFTPADELTEVAGLTLEGDITRAALLSALGQQFLLCAIHSDAGTAITLTAHTNAVQVFPLGTSNHYQRVDLTDIAYLKLVGRVITVSASANNPRLYIQYSITNGSSYTTLGAGTIASGDVVPLFTGTAGTAESNWITIPSEARIPGVWLRVVSDGGNSSASPVVGHLQILAKY